MSRIAKLIRGNALAFLALAVALSSAAYAASLELGQRNTESRTTVITNTGNGPAFRFNVKAGKPPFAVNSGVQVARLNASKLAGKKPKDFASAASTYTKTQADSIFAKLSGVFSRDESDGRYARTLLVLPFSDSATGGQTKVVVDKSVSIPAAGTVMVVIERTLNAGIMNLLLNGTDVSGDLVDDGDPVYTRGYVAPGSLSVKITLDQNNVLDAFIVGHVNVIFIPAQ